jgi:glucose-6-phosphate isomerase, archaeal
MYETKDLPSIFEIDLVTVTMSPYDQHVQRRLSSMQNQFNDLQAYQHMLEVEDVLLYEVYASQRPEAVGELLHGISIVHPGRVGNEYYMTKGHFHSVLETAEAYYCLKGGGFMVMENPEGEWSVEALAPGRVLYVPPRWAHRSVNTGTDDLVTFFVYPGHAGHDYGTIEKQGFRKLVVELDGMARIVDNPRWQSPEARK